MSSFIRRIERTQHPSRRCHTMIVDEKGLPADEGKTIWYDNAARRIHFKGRGSRLGVSNPQAKDLVARLKREKRYAKV